MSKNKQIEPIKPMQITLEGFKFKAMELVIEGKHTIEEWLDAGRLLTGMESSLNWWIGDW